MSEEKKGSKLKEYLYSLLHGLKHVVLHNGWLKFIAVPMPSSAMERTDRISV